MDPVSTQKRQRSPDYPYYSLPECVRFIETLKKRDGLAKIPKKIALEHMGFDFSSNIVWRASSALTGFGLLDEEGPMDSRTFRFTDIGRTIVIIRDVHEPEKKDALQKAALNYDIIKQIRSLWGEGLPSDDVIRAELIRKGFTERAAGRFIVVLRETYDFAWLGGSDILEEETPIEDKMDNNINIGQESKGKGLSVALIPKGFVGYTLTLSKGKEVRLSASDNLSSEDFDFMIQWIKRLDLVKPVSTEQPEVQEQKNDDEEPSIPF